MIIAVVGPTATGKSELALEIAWALGGPDKCELIGGDAMALYRGMDIGTAKIPAHERRGFAHHQVDVLEVTEDASVAAYQREARKDALDIMSRGKTPIVVGGSGLYLRALLDELEFPETNLQVREGLEGELAAVGSVILHRQLEAQDPVAAQRINPANGRRIVRALEVIAITGRPYSATLPTYTYHFDTVQIGLRADKDVLDQRIERRADAMFQGGMMQEISALDAAGIRLGRTARRATGYQEALDALDGVTSVEEATVLTAKATSRLARKQMKWFKRDPRITWLQAGSQDLLTQALAVISTVENVQDPETLA